MDGAADGSPRCGPRRENLFVTPSHGNEAKLALLSRSYMHASYSTSSNGSRTREAHSRDGQEADRQEADRQSRWKKEASLLFGTVAAPPCLPSH